MECVDVSSCLTTRKVIKLTDIRGQVHSVQPTYFQFVQHNSMQRFVAFTNFRLLHVSTNATRHISQFDLTYEVQANGLTHNTHRPKASETHSGLKKIRPYGMKLQTSSKRMFFVQLLFVTLFYPAFFFLFMKCFIHGNRL